MGTRRTATDALASRLDRYDSLVEVGVGARPAVARALSARGCSVTVTDVAPRECSPIDPGGDDVQFVQDDVTDPALDVYRGADAIYALRCPPELQRPLCDLGETVDAACLFTTLGVDSVVVSTTPERFAAGVTVHVARE